MTIDPDVESVSKLFGIDPRLIQAVVRAEGDILKAVQCSLPDTPSRHAALMILCRSAVHAMSDYLHEHDAKGFIEFWGARWAPVGAANDPHGLNNFWDRNVEALWTPQTKV